jgi:hypothetical protein
MLEIELKTAEFKPKLGNRIRTPNCKKFYLIKQLYKCIKG